MRSVYVDKMTWMVVNDTYKRGEEMAPGEFSRNGDREFCEKACLCLVS